MPIKFAFEIAFQKAKRRKKENSWKNNLHRRNRSSRSRVRCSIYFIWMSVCVCVCICVLCVPSLLGRIKFWPIKKFKGKTAAATFMRVQKTIRERQEGGDGRSLCSCVCVWECYAWAQINLKDIWKSVFEYWHKANNFPASFSPHSIPLLSLSLSLYLCPPSAPENSLLPAKTQQESSLLWHALMGISLCVCRPRTGNVHIFIYLTVAQHSKWNFHFWFITFLAGECAWFCSWLLQQE